MSDDIIPSDIEIIDGEVLPDNAEIGPFGEVWIPFRNEEEAQRSWDNRPESSYWPLNPDDWPKK